MNYKMTKFACYFAYLAMASVFALPPVLFVTFKEMYGISYTLLGTLVLANFTTQLIVDLIFTFFTKFFNVKKIVRIMPLITSLGLLLYALIPFFFPKAAFIGLLGGTIVFSISAGLCEVLLSPTIASLPSDNPEKDMSLLHSLYAYGVVFVVLVSTLFLKIFGTDKWMFLTLFWAILPIISSVLFGLSPMPDMELNNKKGAKSSSNVKFGIFLCVMCIFLGSAAENAMTNWISGYIEKALGISKVLGDILGLTLFAIMLGLGRSLYAKYGKNISSVLLWGMIGAAICYMIAGISSVVFVSMFACVATGFFTSMLWPGTLILMEENYPNLGVAAYALMAAGGDFGGSVAPQILGIVVDKVSANSWALSIASKLNLTPEQIGMKAGMLTASLFPMLGAVLLLYIKRKLYKECASE